MKKLFLFVIVVAILALDWVALHDILKGNESSYVLEYMVLFASVVILAGALTKLGKRTSKKKA